MIGIEQNKEEVLAWIQSNISPVASPFEYVTSLTKDKTSFLNCSGSEIEINNKTEWLDEDEIPRLKWDRELELEEAKEELEKIINGTTEINTKYIDAEIKEHHQYISMLEASVTALSYPVIDIFPYKFWYKINNEISREIIFKINQPACISDAIDDNTTFWWGLPTDIYNLKSDQLNLFGKIYHSLISIINYQIPFYEFDNIKSLLLYED